jgi:putative ABC transport system ATP-binding protein
VSVDLERAMPTGPPTGPAVIELREVGRTFPGPPPVEAFKPSNLTIGQGEYVSIIGPSGSGKSTLLHLLGLLDRPTTGGYLLDGIDTGALGDNARAGLRGSRIGFVFQSFHLLHHRSVLENVELAQIYNRMPRKERRQRAVNALERVGLSHRLSFTPRTLSGGERQRVAVARALVTEPSLLLADEPTGNLDTEMSDEIMEVFDGLHNAGMTLAVITHDLDVSNRAERQVSIVDGTLHES